MELSRRDAVAALAAAGVAVGGGVAALRWDALDGAEGLDDHHAETLVALAEVVYPSALEGIPGFVETYVVGRAEDRPDHAAGIREAVATLDATAEDWFGAAFAALSPAERAEALDEMGVGAADPDPEGIGTARVRYYLVNELLYALYASPTGGRLVGIENPQGHPGGIDSYRRGPETVGRVGPPADRGSGTRSGGAPPAGDRSAGGRPDRDPSADGRPDRDRSADDRPDSDRSADDRSANSDDP